LGVRALAGFLAGFGLVVLSEVLAMAAIWGESLSGARGFGVPRAHS